VADQRLAIVTGTHRFPPSLTEGAERRTLPGPRGDIEVLDRGDVVLVNRHGLDERTPVHRVDHAANMTAVATECDLVLAIGSCGSLRTDLAPGAILLLDDVFAPWSTASIFEDARAESLPGFNRSWRAGILDAWAATGEPVIDGGTYVQSPGPRFETPAEVRFYAVVGDVVGMTLAAEMVAAGEAGLMYAATVMVDNMASGLAAEPLTIAQFEAAVASNRDALWSAVTATTAALGHRL
jgi:5'-methylthioadenosine phosphorylase